MKHSDALLLTHLAQCIQTSADLERNLTDDELVRFLVPTKDGQRAVLKVCRNAQMEGVLKQILSIVAFQCVQQILVALDEGVLGVGPNGSYTLMRADPRGRLSATSTDLHEFIGDAVIAIGLDPPRADLTVLD